MPSLPDQTGRTLLVTGATSGIGRAATLSLLRAGATVLAVGRSEEKLAALVAEAGAGERLRPLRCDLSVMAEVAGLGAQVREEVDRLDVLVNNAGAYFKTREVSADGLELTFAVNHLAYFLLTRELLPLLEASAPARVVSTSSDAHRLGPLDFDDLQLERSYPRAGFTAYGTSKLCNVLFTRELARRLEGSGVEAACLHPGFVASGFAQNNGWLASVMMTLSRPFQRNTDQGADTLLWLATAPESEWKSGGYYVDRKLKEPSKYATDHEVAERLWRVSEALVAEALA